MGSHHQRGGAAAATRSFAAPLSRLLPTPEPLMILLVHELWCGRRQPQHASKADRQGAVARLRVDGPITTHSSRHGTKSSISARNPACRVCLRFFSKVTIASVSFRILRDPIVSYCGSSPPDRSVTASTRTFFEVPQVKEREKFEGSKLDLLRARSFQHDGPAHLLRE